MIKDLIKDLAYDNIELSQALTRAKLIASKVKNDIFKQWLIKELEGYKPDDKLLPKYRMLGGELYLRVEYPFRHFENFPAMYTGKNSEIMDSFRHHKIVEPIATIETMYNALTEARAQIPLFAIQVEILAEPYQAQVSRDDGIIRSGYRLVHSAHIKRIIDITKQTLLNTLIELDEQFPNLENEYNMTDENKEKTQNIITTNIYGNNNPVNVASGHIVHQTNNIHVITEDEYQKLIDLGVPKEKLDELKDVQLESAATNDKESLVKRVYHWLGDVSSHVAAIGLAHNIPAILELVHHSIK